MIPKAALAFAELPDRRRVGRSRRDGYHVPRARKLSPDQAAAIRADGGRRSLRELAVAFGVSHETVRRALRERERNRAGTPARAP